MRHNAIEPVLHLTPAKTDGHLIYAIGDVHGCYDQLARLLAAIVDNAEVNAGGRRPVLVFCGDYVDRGPDSARVLSTLAWLRRHGAFELHLLMGNHERAMLDFLAEPARMADWMAFGGDATLESYGVTPPDEAEGAAGLVRARDDLLDQMPVSHLRLVEGLELIIGIGDYAFVHAGIRPGVPLGRQVEDDLLWIRDPFLDAELPHEKVIVHGHTWDGARPAILGNRLGIDTGTYETGVLTAVRLDDGIVEVLQAGG